MEQIAVEESKGKELTLYKRVAMTGSSYGAMAYKKNTTEFFYSFFKNNDDQRNAMAMLAMEGHSVRRISKTFLIIIARSTSIKRCVLFEQSTGLI